MKNKIIKFDYAAGKVTNAISGTYSHDTHRVIYGGEAIYNRPEITVTFVSNGTGTIQKFTDGAPSPSEQFTWYTGEMPVSGAGGLGETQFSITQTHVSGSNYECGIYKSTYTSNGDPIFPSYTENRNYLSTTTGVTVTGSILNEHDALYYMTNPFGTHADAISLRLAVTAFGPIVQVNNAVTLTRGGLSKTYNFDLTSIYSIS